MVDERMLHDAVEGVLDDEHHQHPRIGNVGKENTPKASHEGLGPGPERHYDYVVHCRGRYCEHTLGGPPHEEKPRRHPGSAEDARNGQVVCEAVEGELGLQHNVLPNLVKLDVHLVRIEEHQPFHSDDVAKEEIDKDVVPLVGVPSPAHDVGDDGRETKGVRHWHYEPQDVPVPRASVNARCLGGQFQERAGRDDHYYDGDRHFHPLSVGPVPNDRCEDQHITDDKHHCEGAPQHVASIPEEHEPPPVAGALLAANICKQHPNQLEEE
mmetsp:Transcript_8467/g.19892  ORF Transcript_8467/g.19892 Transcript_8467/m.19892 type:complete len:268 (+) Transcript_8467:1095-1898(+)